MKYSGFTTLNTVKYCSAAFLQISSGFFFTGKNDSSGWLEDQLSCTSTAQALQRSAVPRSKSFILQTSRFHRKLFLWGLPPCRHGFQLWSLFSGRHISLCTSFPARPSRKTLHSLGTTPPLGHTWASQKHKQTQRFLRFVVFNIRSIL